MKKSRYFNYYFDGEYAGHIETRGGFTKHKRLRRSFVESFGNEKHTVRLGRTSSRPKTRP